MRKFVLLVFGSFLALKSVAQINAFVSDDIEKKIAPAKVAFFNKARLSFETKQYAEANIPLDSLLTAYPDCIGLRYLKGISGCFKADKVSTALELLKSTISYSAQLEHYPYWLGYAFEENDSLAKAKLYFEIAAKSILENTAYDKELIADAKRRVENMKMANKMKFLRNTVQVKNIGSPVNTEADEYVPLLPSDESFMVFTYRGKLSKGGKQNLNKQHHGTSKKEEGIYFEDLFTAERINDSTWGEPHPIRSINTQLHDAAVTLSSDGNLLFTYKNIGTGYGDLYLSKLVGNTWSAPEYQKGLNTGAWEGSAAFFPGNKFVIFSSERKGGYGGKDLYKAEKINENTWGNIINLGPVINSADDEDAPFITSDGKILFFASNGKLSTGGYDILRSDMVEGVWTAPYNIGKPVNTPNDDKFYIVSGDGKKGYYSTQMDGGKGGQDIYCIQPGIAGKPVSVVQLSGNITFNDKPAEASIQVNSIKKKDIGSQTFVSNSTSGKFLINLPTNNDYEFIFKYKDLATQTKTISTKDVDSSIILNMIADFYSDAYKKRLEDKRDSLDKLNNLANAGVSVDEFKKNYGDLVIDSLFYKIQIGAYKFIENFDYTRSIDLGIIIRKVYDDGITRFTIGNFKTFNEALDRMDAVKEYAVKDSFIIVLYKNKYYYLKDILQKGLLKNSAGQ
jgi:hypothetical protein